MVLGQTGAPSHLFTDYFVVAVGPILHSDASHTLLECSPTGERIVGFDAFRLLCALLDLEGPRRLKGEPPLRTESELREMLRLQVAKSGEELLERAKLGLGIYRADQVRALAEVAAGAPESVITEAKKSWLDEFRTPAGG